MPCRAVLCSIVKNNRSLVREIDSSDERVHLRSINPILKPVHSTM